MKTIDTTTQLGLFAAAAHLFGAAASAPAPDPKTLSAAGLLTASLAPTFDELAAHHAAAGLPPIDEASYEAMLASARAFAVTVATAGETQH